MAVRVKRKGDQLRGEGVVKIVAEYQQVRGMREMWEKKEKELKERLDTIVETQGTLDDKGHRWFELPEPVGDITKILKQKRVTQSFNQDIAEVLLKREGDDIWERCTTEVTVIDEDAVLALAFEKEIPEAVMDEIIGETTNYAFYLK